MKYPSSAKITFLTVLLLSLAACNHDDGASEMPSTPKVETAPITAATPTPPAATPVPISTPEPSPTPRTCPTNFVPVPANADFNVTPFCVSKYEAKDVAGSPEALPQGNSWSNISRNAAIAACASKGDGYALLDNAHWMTIARNIESVTWNWGGFDVPSYGVSRGLTSNENDTAGSPASTDDNDSCYLAYQRGPTAPAVCDLNTFHANRRVHKLTNDSLIWDLAGNVAEWVSDDFNQNYLAPSWVLNVTDTVTKNLFGPAGTYPAGPTSPPGNNNMYNFGYFGLNSNNPSQIARGGAWNYGRYGGIYTAYEYPVGATGADIGFRCMYQL